MDYKSIATQHKPESIRERIHEIIEKSKKRKKLKEKFQFTKLITQMENCISLR